MASINGIEIKSLKTFRGHDGTTFLQGNVYYRNKKLGFWSQDAWCGPDLFEFKESILDEEVQKYKKSVPLDDERYRDIISLEILLGDLVRLIQTEKDFKKGLKNGYKAYVNVRNQAVTGGYFTNFSGPDLLQQKFHTDYVRKFAKQYDENVYGKVQTDVWTSADQFNIVYG